ncbi:CHAT domain-containing protein [Ephemerocybe angulata]|uniref:CHAT domain-containing protein n=1 Tax=Ephemerocybe angulata TaxID=980116 RepID=A0A8H6LZ01_9AGAR|nr:CHAT domain-containing protein [Tulosesus angulatus]
MRRMVNGWSSRMLFSNVILLDIIFECTNTHEGGGTPMHLVDLWIMETPGSGQAKLYPLTHASPGRWELNGFIEILADTDAIDCIVRSDEEEDVGFLRLDMKGIRSTRVSSYQELSRDIEVFDEETRLIMRWKGVETSPERPQIEDDVAAQFNGYAMDLLRAFERTGDLPLLTESISCVRQAVDITPEGHSKLPVYLCNLGCTLMRRFERMGELTDITEAVAAQQEAAALIPEGHANMPRYLINLGNSLTSGFEQTGELSDITNAIAVQKKAVDLTPQGHACLPSRLSNLGCSFGRRFERTGELSDITNAIAVAQKAVDLTPLGHADLPSHLSNLGGSLTRRFERTGELSDIADAVSVWQKSVDLTPEGHADLPGYLNNLGNSLTGRFERTGDLLDITNAIAVLQEAVDLTPRAHADLPGYLKTLGASLTRRFERTGELSDIANAITVQEKAVDLTPQGHAALPGCLNNLGTSLKCRFKHTGEPTDIANAIEVQQKSVDLTPQGHADLPDRLSTLGAMFYNRFGSSGKTADLEETISCYKTAAMSTAGPPRAKLEAAHLWARTLIRHRSQSPEIIPAFDIAIGLVAIIAGLEQTLKGRYTQLESTSTLALEAAAAACALGRPDKALEWLEQGRCLVWNQLNNLRTPLDDLRIQDEILAHNIADVSKQLEHAGSSRGQSHVDMPLSEKMSLEDEARSHLDLARRWDDLLRKARAIPGFESFLMALPCSAIMQHLPESGPIVVININKRRCDALALLAGLDEPLHIPLPNFSIKTASDYRAALDSRLRTNHLRTREVEDMAALLEEARGMRPAPVKKRRVDDDPVHRVLRGLWEKVVKPILDGLGFSIVDQSSGEGLPRLWWCPTGPLSFLPLHAAGIYQGSDSECGFDYVVSSYTPTVTSLTDRVKNHGSIDAKAAGLLLTSQPNAPGAPPIPGTTKEIRAIAERAEKNGVRAKKLEGNEISIEACLEEMKDFSSVHLACHGSQNAAEPLQSRFLFHQGSLELGTILKSNLKNADLAFLSACQTSTGQEKLADEAVHLAAGMLAAGYRRVIGTMWSIGDAPAQQVAITFYEYLFSHRDGTSGAGFDGTHSAIALHHATEKLRLSLDDSEHSFLTWIPFVHFGY